jgi:hypothetical protein
MKRPPLVSIRTISRSLRRLLFDGSIVLYKLVVWYVFLDLASFSIRVLKGSTCHFVSELIEIEVRPL